MSWPSRSPTELCSRPILNRSGSGGGYVSAMFSVTALVAKLCPWIGNRQIGQTIGFRAPVIQQPRAVVRHPQSAGDDAFGVVVAADAR